MPYKDKEKQKNYWKEKKKQQRLSTPDDVHPEMSTPYRPIILALADPASRGKLRAICDRLSGRSTGKRNYLGEVYYGVGINPTLFSEIDLFLTAFD